MQSGWLRQFFHQHDAQCGHGVEAADATAEVKATDDVSRRDFVKTGFAAGVAAGMAAGTVVAQTSPAAGPAGEPDGSQLVALPWGAERREGRLQSADPRQGDGGGAAHQDRAHLSPQPGARGRDPALRCPAHLPHHPRRPDGRPRRHALLCITTTRCSAARSARSARSSTGSAISPSRSGTTSVTTTDSPRSRSEAPTACRSSVSKTSAPFSPAASCSTSPPSRASIASPSTTS